MSAEFAQILEDKGVIAVMETLFQTLGYITNKLFTHGTGPILTILSTVIPIYVAAHATLRRPQSAAPKASKGNEDSVDQKVDVPRENEVKGRLSLDLSDAVLFPVQAGLMLYLLDKSIRNMDPVTISKTLNGLYVLLEVSFFAKMLTDSASLAFDFIFPDAYRRGGKVWIMRQDKQLVECDEDGKTASSPLPGIFAQISLPAVAERAFWRIRGSLRSNLSFKWACLGDLGIETISVINVFTFPVSLSAVLYSNLVGGTWYLSNVFAFSFAYTGLQMISPNTFGIAAILLSGLCLYDVFMVFYTSMMDNVALSLDIPAKIIIPSPSGVGMIGLGDIVLPGIVMAWALRFDLWRHYVYKWTLKDGHEKKCTADSHAVGSALIRSDPGDIQRATYQSATSFWGTRFWTYTSASKSKIPVQGTNFSKQYFHATLTGYTLGLIVAIIVGQYADRSQPALLYLVPGVLGSLFLTAAIRGEFKLLRSYEEDKHWVTSTEMSYTKAMGKKLKQLRVDRRRAKGPNWLLSKCSDNVVIWIDFVTESDCNEILGLKTDLESCKKDAEALKEENADIKGRLDEEFSDGAVLLKNEEVESLSSSDTSSDKDKDISPSSSSSGSENKIEAIEDDAEIMDKLRKWVKRHQDGGEDAKTKKPEWAREHLVYFALKHVPFKGMGLVITEEGLVEMEEDGEKDVGDG